MEKHYEVKNCALEIKDVDTTKGIVVGYFSAFDNLDADRDIMIKGCYAKSIMENGPASKNPRIKHLWQHDIWSPIGKLLKLEEDNVGLRFESQMSKATKGNDALIMYKEGIITEHSVGFRTINKRTHDDYTEILEAKLWEGSAVTWGANSLTPVVDMKGLSKEDQLSKLNERMNKLVKFFRTGTVTDEAFRDIEIELTQIQELQKSLLIQEPPVGTPEDKEPSDDDILSKLTTFN